MQRLRSLALKDKKYKGVLHPDSLRWCHGREGLEHKKVRKFRYPLWKYARISEVRIVLCVCENCSMLFFGEHVNGARLKINVDFSGSDFEHYLVPVTLNGRSLGINAPVVRRGSLGWNTNQEIINISTKEFIEKIQ